MAIGGALFESVAFDHGQIASSSLSGYRVPRFTDVPELDAVPIDRPDPPSVGPGETPPGPARADPRLRHRPRAPLPGPEENRQQRQNKHASRRDKRLKT